MPEMETDPPCNLPLDQVGGWRGTADTCELVEKSHQMYLEKKVKGEDLGTRSTTQFK